MLIELLKSLQINQNTLHLFHIQTQLNILLWNICLDVDINCFKYLYQIKYQIRFISPQFINSNLLHLYYLFNKFNQNIIHHYLNNQKPIKLRILSLVLPTHTTNILIKMFEISKLYLTFFFHFKFPLIPNNQNFINLCLTTPYIAFLYILGLILFIIPELFFKLIFGVIIYGFFICFFIMSGTIIFSYIPILLWIEHVNLIWTIFVITTLRFLFYHIIHYFGYIIAVCLYLCVYLLTHVIITSCYIFYFIILTIRIFLFIGLFLFQTPLYYILNGKENWFAERAPAFGRGSRAAPN